MLANALPRRLPYVANISLFVVAGENALGVGQSARDVVKSEWDYAKPKTRRYNPEQSAIGCKRAWEARVHRKKVQPEASSEKTTGITYRGRRKKRAILPGLRFTRGLSKYNATTQWWPSLSQARDPRNGLELVLDNGRNDPHAIG